LIQYLKYGINKWTLALGPMAEAVSHSNSQLSDDDIHAIAAHLKTAINLLPRLAGSALVQSDEQATLARAASTAGAPMAAAMRSIRRPVRPSHCSLRANRPFLVSGAPQPSATENLA
jgi:hypothetical protein